MLLKGHGCIRRNGINIIRIKYRQGIGCHVLNELCSVSNKKFTVYLMVFHSLFNLAKS